ncbi:unnamed protein product [Cuscuta epithymum]|uniref:Uncharacterized protein n=1 Tax=Cuscuta epithymum TaxID=186058 RepID=A0AAV0EAU1_9ASTE|nr:unnamed protein product [Cuscuta epithymum]
MYYTVAVTVAAAGRRTEAPPQSSPELSGGGSVISATAVSRLGCRPFPFLLVRESSGLALTIFDLSQVHPHSSGSKRVGLGAAPVLLVGGSEPPDEGVEAAPGLLQRAGAGGGRVRVAEMGAAGHVHLRLPELIEVPKELDHVRSAAPRQRQRRLMVPQVLQKCSPIPPLL